MPQIVAENFTTGGRGSPNAWSPASDGNNWTVDSGGPTQSIVSSQGKITGFTTIAAIHLGSATSIDFDVVVRVKVNTGNFTAAGIIARQTATNTFYRARLSSNANTFGIVKTVAGTTTNLSIPAFTVNTALEYWIRFKGIGPNLFAMIWADGTAVPTSWFATANDSSITTAGTIGVHATTTNSADIALFDNFYAADYPDFEIADLTSFVADTTTDLTNSFTTTITDSQLSSFVADATTLANFSFTTTITDSQLSSFVADATVQKTNEITEQLTTFSAEATVTWSYAAVSTGIHVFISGVEVLILEGSFEIDDAINTISTCSFTVRDDTGTNHYTKRQKIVILDSVKGLIFTGFIDSVEEDRQSPQTMIFAKVDIRDNHDLAEKRTYPGPDFTNAFAGTIATSLLDILVQEGVTAPYASRRDTTQGQFNLGTLSGVVGTSNVDDGDLELSPAGTDVVYSEGITGGFFGNAIKFSGKNQAGYATAATYREIWTGSQVIVSGDSLSYDIWIASSSPGITAIVDLAFSDGTFFSSYPTTAAGTDGQGISAAISNDLTGYANDQWYTRGHGVGGSVIGKTITGIYVALYGTTEGQYTAYFRRIKWINGATTKITAFADNTTAFQANIIGQTTGFINATMSIVQAVETTTIATTTIDLSSAIVAKSSFVTWVEAQLDTNNDTTIARGAITVQASLDGVAVQTLANGGTIPQIIAGMNTTGITLTLTKVITAGIYADLALEMSSLTFILHTSYAATKTDVDTTYSYLAANFGGGTFTNLTTSSNILVFNGFAIPFNSTNDYTGHTTTYNVNSLFLLKRTLAVNVASATTGVVRLDTPGNTWQDFTAEVDVVVSSIASNDAGLTFRTTNHGTGSSAFSYYAGISQTNVFLRKGTNTTGGSSITTLANPTIALSSGSTHRLKVVTSGTSIKVSVDDVLMVNTTDSSFNIAGYLGLRFATVGSDTTYFSNFGVVPSLSGTWVSPAFSLASATTYGNSYLIWDDEVPDTVTITVEISYNNGSSYATCTRGAALPGRSAGDSLTSITQAKIRLTLTAANASELPQFGAVSAWVFGQYTSSGNRISPSLPLTSVGRLGSSVVAWNALLPTGTTLGVDVRFNGGAWNDVTSHNGEPWPVLLGQPDPIFDTFDTDTSANYTASHRSGGSDATATHETANSRVSLVGGSKAFYVYDSSTTITDVDTYVDMDRSDSGGIVWVYQNVDNFIELVIADDTASSNPNTISVFRCNSGTRTQQGSNTAITFARGSYHRFRLHYDYNSHIATIYQNGTIILTTTAISSGSSGTKIGLRNDGGTSRYYSLQIQALSVDVSGYSVQSRLRLTSTDATVTPQVTDHTLAGYGLTIHPGALVPQTDYIFKYISDCFDDLIKQSSVDGGQWWWTIDKYLTAYMLPNNGMPSPWVASSIQNADLSADFLDAGLTVTDASDLFRNRQIITNVMDTIAINETRQGDGVSRTWTFAYGFASAPTITVNSVAATVGIKGVDTGKTFYWAIDDPVISVDDSIATYSIAYLLGFDGTGQFLTNSQYDDLVLQGVIRGRDGTSGIIENVEDGTGLTKLAGDALAQARVKQYGVLGKRLEATTLREGLTPGMLFPAFIPEHNLFDTLMLIRSIKTRLTPDGATGLHKFWYSIEAISGADTGDWSKMYLRKNQ